MEKLIRIAERFASELEDRLGEKILGIYLFGSTAKGTATEGSDIDVLVVYSDVDEWSLLEVASEISFKILCEEGRLIETVPMAKQEFEESLGRSPFLFEVLNFGRPIFTRLSGTEWELDFKAYLDILQRGGNRGKIPTKGSSHNIEHLYSHEVPVALKEFLRVLKPEGFLVITCPDLQSVAKLIVEDKLTETAYIAPVGPIAPIDILYGYRPALARGNLFMAHRCGLTLKVLMGSLKAAGFQTVAGKARPKDFDLWAVASKMALDEGRIREVAQT